MWRIVFLAAFVASHQTSKDPIGSPADPQETKLAETLPPADPIHTKPCYPLPIPKPDITDWDGAIIDTEWWQYIRTGLRETERAPSELASSYSRRRNRSKCIAPENMVNALCNTRCRKAHPNVRNSVCLENNYQTYEVWAFCPYSIKRCQRKPWKCIKQIEVRMPQCCECWSCWDMKVPCRVGRRPVNKEWLN